MADWFVFILIELNSFALFQNFKNKGDWLSKAFRNKLIQNMFTDLFQLSYDVGTEMLSSDVLIYCISSNEINSPEVRVQSIMNHLTFKRSIKSHYT